MSSASASAERRRAVHAFLSAALLLTSATACSRRDSEPPRVATAPIATAAAPSGTSSMPHGDHNPHHGGIVMMKGDLHFEVVANAAGSYHVYFTDAARADLPAAAAQAVSLTVHRTNEPDEAIAMRIDDSGESWEGRGRAVERPDDATVRVAFTIKGDEPYWIDLPYRVPGGR